ncbi:hypothetical protein DOTSEDRAFT_37541 [Dothistroma septosporum NZE10]|uniref:Uncharacterized protein n=1 Tax=Dothistroma septosporum (strain NZE10 / CBS 128990) TaxID=675120 RepID=N1PGX8_DOTSN|nr:hypothetical protein DOTSEDRAFT_37541 [Dothistroma septosporum NZE10]
MLPLLEQSLSYDVVALADKRDTCAIGLVRDELDTPAQDLVLKLGYLTAHRIALEEETSPGFSAFGKLLAVIHRHEQHRWLRMVGRCMISRAWSKNDVAFVKRSAPSWKLAITTLTLRWLR